MIERAWRCTVCGYIHRGPEPPEWCPVCGSPAAEFEPYDAAAAPRAGLQAAGLRCLNCGFPAPGGEPPDECPVCGSPADRFEAVAEAATAAAAGSTAKVLIVGAGIAGLSALEAIREAAPGAELTLISRERELPYYRLNLTRYLAGEVTEDELPIHPAAWYEEQGIRMLLGEEVGELRPGEHGVVLCSQEVVPYERLILTAGAHPFIPPVAGAHREGVFSVRTVEDARELLTALRPGVRCLVVGGGLLGLETAAALGRRGAEATVLEGHEWLMPRQLNRRAGELLAEHLRTAGIRLLTQARPKEIVGDERVAGVDLDDGLHLETDCVVIATGVRPNSHLARRAGLDVNQGVVVDNALVSSRPDILAAGDVAEHRGVLYGNWFASQYQGRIAGLNAVGSATEFGESRGSNTLKVVGLDLLSVGRFEPEDGSYYVIEEEADGRYARFVFHDGRFIGAVLLGDASAAGAVKKAIESGCECSELLRKEPTAADILEHLQAR
ncbi:MAG: pyridine nucleotide-disulfide oxidoreductase [Armatimonadetes bacterium]|nr:pyridine nucleotide-disulfide oxidoreductase [Armatimonadota bacterium]